MLRISPFVYEILRLPDKGTIKLACYCIIDNATGPHIWRCKYADIMCSCTWQDAVERRVSHGIF